MVVKSRLKHQLNLQCGLLWACALYDTLRWLSNIIRHSGSYINS